MASGDEQRESGGSVSRHLLALLVVAAVAFTCLAIVVAAREAHAPAWANVAEYTSGGEVADRAPTVGANDTAVLNAAALLVEGTRSSAAAAVRALIDGDVTAAAVAADAAMRAAEVGRGGTAGAVQARFGLVLQDIREARRARQNGNGGRALTLLTRVAAELGATPVGQSVEVVPPRTDLSGYDGARLLNAAGELIGTVVEVAPSDADSARVTLVIGGHHHVLGLFDIGGRKVGVSANRLIFGARRHFGPTFVVLATLNRSAGLAGPR